jgi:hypothetical protein
MPLAAYFRNVGAMLLALLFIADFYHPATPVAQRAAVDPPVIRIYSDRKWPERIAYDTSQPTIVPVQIAAAEADVPVLAMGADVAATANIREAFAQMPSAVSNPPKLPAARRRAATRQREHKIVRNPVPRIVLVARQPHFGWFGSRVW